MNRSRYILFRTVQSILLTFVVVTFLFFFFRLLPGDITTLMTQSTANPEAVAQFERKWGLNDPLHIQYFNYIINFIQGDAGISLTHREPVVTIALPKLFNTLILVAPAMTLSYLIGGVLGAVMGMSVDSALDRYGIIPFVVMGAVPSFFTGIILIIFFSGSLGWLPSGGIISTSARFSTPESAWWTTYLHPSFINHYALPFTAIIIRYTFFPLALMRTSVVEVLGQDFFDYHRLTGMPYTKRLRRLATHASLPILTAYPVSLTRAIGGLVLIETVFNWPGMGLAMVDAVINRNFPLLQFVFFLLAVFIIFANFFVDILYSLIDPRISIEDGSSTA